MNFIALRPMMLLVIVICLSSCHRIPFYHEESGPKWMSNDCIEEPQSTDSTLCVVSYNIEYGERIQEAIHEIESDSRFNHADLILLQEMDQEGVILMAEKLGYNYLYYPISFNLKQQQNYGNAILSKYTMTETSKIILPHIKWTDDRRRSATAATILYQNKSILIYSLHTETFIMSKSKRMDQIKDIMNHALALSDTADYMIIGGDFNTLFGKDCDEVVDLFTQNGFHWASKGIGNTGSEIFNLWKPTLDHIFTRGFDIVDSGKKTDTEASDHLPIFVEMIYNK